MKTYDTFSHLFVVRIGSYHVIVVILSRAFFFSQALQKKRVSQIFTQNSHFFDLVINLKKIRDAHLFIHFIRITGIYSNTVTLVIVISVSDLVPGMGEIDLKVKGLWGEGEVGRVYCQ